MIQPSSPNAVPGRPLDGIDAIVIGASAGGIDALSMLLPALPADLDAAVCIVVHLPRQQESLLVDIFGRRCALPVVEAEDKLPLTRGRVYVAPPDYHLLLDRGPSLALSVDEPVHHSRPSIDVLFESAADVLGPRVLGIVLSGANQDGADGLATIGRAGGVTVVQEPSSALSQAMPTAAIARGGVDFVLSMPAMADLLRTLARAAPSGALPGASPARAVR